MGIFKALSINKRMSVGKKRMGNSRGNVSCNQDSNSQASGGADLTDFISGSHSYEDPSVSLLHNMDSGTRDGHYY